MLWIDIKYANMLSIQLERYTVKTQNPFLAELALSFRKRTQVSRSQKFKSKFFVIISLVMTYLTGPVGLVFYWLFRVLYSKKINYYE